MRIAYIAPEYGALTSTFIYREVKALRGLGIEVVTFSTTRPREQVVSAEAKREIEATTYLYETPKTVVFAGAFAMALRAPIRLLHMKWRLVCDVLTAQASPSDRLKLIWHGFVGAYLAGRLKREGVQHLHAHFAHVPTSIAMYAATLAGIPYSFTGHANDIYERGVALKQKVNRSAFSSCISDYNIRYLTSIGANPEKLHIVRCAIDVSEYAFMPPRSPQGKAAIFSVGRLVEKKGITYLIEAVKILRARGIDVVCRVAGNGPLLDSLTEQVKRDDLEDSVDLMGSQPQERVRELLRNADVFALPCVRTESGDIDGIPVALMEAMAMGVPVVSTAVSGIPELIRDGESGLLARERDAASLADAIANLLTNAEETLQFTQAARRTIETEFEVTRNAERLKRLMESAVMGTPS